MPELVQESTPPPAPPPLPPGRRPPLPPPEDGDDPPPAIPPVIDPQNFEDFPTFRETFLLYVTDPDANAALRGFGKLLFDGILALWGDWPDHPEGLFRASLRAAIADLRHVEGVSWRASVMPPSAPSVSASSSAGAKRRARSTASAVAVRPTRRRPAVVKTSSGRASTRRCSVARGHMGEISCGNC
jgi:hypothetical protein